MSLLQKIATRFVPSRMKREKVMALHLQTAITLLRKLREKDPALTDEIFVASMEEVGRTLAKQMRTELKIGNRFSDAVDAWKIACRISDMKVTLTPDRDGIAFEHHGCPLWLSCGKTTLLCDTLCLPMVRGMTDEIQPGARTELIRPADAQQACIKCVRPPEETT